MAVPARETLRHGARLQRNALVDFSDDVDCCDNEDDDDAKWSSRTDSSLFLFRYSLDLFLFF